VLGTVPVEPDGSAFFEAPAMRSLLFVALDEQDLAVKRMQSFTALEPGETLGCVGCHEHRTAAPLLRAAALPLAARRSPSPIAAIAGASDVPDFPRDVQPILDQHCLACHDYGKRDGGVILSGDRGPMFSHSYYTLVVWKQVRDGRNYARSNYPPRTLGSGGSPLMGKLDVSHYRVSVSPRQRQTVRLWLDAGAPYPGTYAALGTGMIGGYQANAEILENDAAWPETRAAVAAFDRRCAGCHHGKQCPLPRSLADENGLSFWSPDMNDPRLRHSRHIVFNLSRPEKSLVLLAPLARAAGGYEICRGPQASRTGIQPVERPHGQNARATPGRPEVLPHTDPAAVGSPIFADRTDADYRAILTMCEAGRRRLDQIKRFDMPGFRPRPEYLREMKRFGVLPASLDLDKDPINVYSLDRRYWALFGWKPE